MNTHDSAKKQHAIDLKLELGSLTRYHPNDTGAREYRIQRLKDIWTELEPILKECRWILDDVEYQNARRLEKPVDDSRRYLRSY